MNPVYADKSTLWQISEDDIMNGDLMAILGTTGMYALVGGDGNGNMTMSDDAGGNCSGLTSNASGGYSGIDLFSGNLWLEPGTGSCDTEDFMYMNYSILCLAY